MQQIKKKNDDLLQKIQDLPLSLHIHEEIVALIQDLVTQGSDIDQSIANEDDVAQLEYRTLSNALTIRSQSESQDSARQASMSF